MRNLEELTLNLLKERQTITYDELFKFFEGAESTVSETILKLKDKYDIKISFRYPYGVIFSINKGEHQFSSTTKRSFNNEQ